MSLAMINCAACRGIKKIKGLGNIEHDCPACKGIGWVEIPETELKVTLKDVMDNPKRKKKKSVENVLQC
jgi:phage FluMu protein Com